MIIRPRFFSGEKRAERGPIMTKGVELSASWMRCQIR